MVKPMSPPSVQVHRNHYRRFEEEFMKRPDVVEHVEAGTPVCEYFFDQQGNHHYCFDPPREAFDEWIKTNPDPDKTTSLREEFVEDLADHIKIRMNIMLYQDMAGPREGQERQLMAEAMYKSVARDVIGVVLSMTDDRPLNGATYRLTSEDGTVIPFDRPGFENELGAMGIIRMFHEAVNT